MTDLDRIFGPVAASTRCALAMRETLEHVVQLAVELAREGREGRKIHTASTLYDSDGRVVASAEHVWITVDPTTFN